MAGGPSDVSIDGSRLNRPRTKKPGAATRRAKNECTLMIATDEKLSTSRTMRNGDPFDVSHVPPHDSAAESAVLGAMAVGRDDERLSATHFYVESHRKMFRAIADMRGEGTPVDGVTVAHELQRRGELEAVGGVAAILRILDAPPEADRIGYYAEIVLDHWQRRRDLERAEAVARIISPADHPGEIIAAWHDERPSRKSKLKLLTAGVLLKQHPRLHPAVVGGLIRAAEILNIISGSKIGKSWLGYSLLLSIATGRNWLDRFPCQRGRVLLIDNELHRPTLAFRIKKVADAMGLRSGDWEDQLDIISLRGCLRSLNELAVDLREIEKGTYRLILLDAKYRFSTAGTSENDNAAETLVYNLLDEIAEHTGAAIALIHHSTKGDQAGKRVTDVGSGAGAQSRAADAHLVLREHEEPDCVVAEAAVRSFPPVEPLPLRWAFPLWVPACHLDPEALRGRKTAGDERQSKRDKNSVSELRRLMHEHGEPVTRRWLRKASGWGEQRVNRTIRAMLDDEIITVPETTTDNRGRDVELFQLT